MLVKIYSAAPVGIDAVKVTIEVHAVPGFDFMDSLYFFGNPRNSRYAVSFKRRLVSG